MAEKENMRLYDTVEEGLTPGIWTVQSSQTLTADGKGVETDGLGTAVKIHVENPVFSVRREAVVQRSPLPGSQGCYTDLIPHLVVNGCIDGKRAGLFLLLLKKEEILQKSEMTARQYLGQAPGVARAVFPMPSEETQKRIYSCIQVAGECLDRLLPQVDELDYLSHYRQVYIGDKPEMSLDGYFTVFLSNRLPEYEAGIANAYEAHLVTLQGLLEQNVQGEDAGKQTLTGRTVELLSLDSWEFVVSGKQPEGFRKICERMQADTDTEWMYRLPVPQGEVPASVKDRLKQGFIPLEYHTRMGDRGIGWGRSPLIPCKAEEMQKKAAYETSDAALCYDEQDHMFDLTYAAAFEAGRLTACQDQAYMESLFLLRQEVQKRLDGRYMDRLWGFDQPVTDALKELLTGVDWEGLGEPFLQTMAEEESSAVPMTAPEEDQAKLEEFIREKSEEVSEELTELLTPVTEWLAKLLLLYPLPLENLLLHEALLPKESVRFFFVDQNWQYALLDGALSIGLYSRRQSLFNQVMRRVLTEGTWRAMYDYRARLYGIAPPERKSSVWTGWILRAEVAALWPTLSVEAEDKEGRKLAILRMQHLSTDTLLAIFDGTAAKVVVHEPEESLVLKLDQEEDRIFREDLSVLKLAPKQDNGLIRKIQRESQGAQVGAAAFARHFMTMGQRTVFGEEGKTGE